MPTTSWKLHTSSLIRDYKHCTTYWYLIQYVPDMILLHKFYCHLLQRNIDLYILPITTESSFDAVKFC